MMLLICFLFYTKQSTPYFVLKLISYIRVYFIMLTGFYQHRRDIVTFVSIMIFKVIINNPHYYQLAGLNIHSMWKVWDKSCG